MSKRKFIEPVMVKNPGLNNQSVISVDSDISDSPKSLFRASQTMQREGSTQHKDFKSRKFIN